MTRNEKRLVVGVLAVGALTVVGSIVAAGVLLIFGLNMVTVERSRDGATVAEAPVAVTVAAKARDEAQAAGNVLERLREDVTSGDGSGPQEASVLPAPQADLGADLSALYGQVNPGVVKILVVKTATAFGNMEVPQEGVGSGWVYDDRHIVTNNHVAEGADDLEIVFADGERRNATVVGADVFSDLAVLEVEDMPGTARILPVVDDFDALEVGEPVVAIGSPFSEANSMTFGIISALGRTIPDGVTNFAIPQTIQTDAAINPGNSGGPLLNLRGEVIGVNAQINTTNVGVTGTPSNSGVGFAIPGSIVAKVVPVLIDKGSYAWSYMGVTGGTITLDVAEANNLPGTQGAYISCVPAGGPSSGALEGADNIRCDATGASGLTGDSTTPRGGDVVTAINGEPVRSFDDLLAYIALETSPGETVRLSVLRDGQEQDVEITLGTRPRSNQ